MAQATLVSKFTIHTEDAIKIYAAPKGFEPVATAEAGREAFIFHEPALAGRASRLVEALKRRGVRILGSLECGGEACKSVEWAIKAWRALLEAKASRGTTVIIIGGGALSDAAGFVASTFMRGLKTILVPSTTLSMFDAAVGGKTAVNLNGKNVVGTFHHPSTVIVDPSLALALPERSYKDGFAELVKHSLLAGGEGIALVEVLGPKAANRDPGALLELAVWSLLFKMSVVARDPRESGLRRILNLGHTVGHALEAASGYSLTHGEAVAIGLVAELELSSRIAGLDPKILSWTRMVLRRFGLPIEPPGGIDLGRAAKLVLLDKKRVNDKILMPLLRRPGDVYIDEVPVDLVIKIISSLGGGSGGS